MNHESRDNFIEEEIEVLDYFLTKY